MDGFYIDDDAVKLKIGDKSYNEDKIIKLIKDHEKHLNYKKVCGERYRNSEKGREKQLEYSRKYYVKNREKILEKARQKYHNSS